jgi:hypothetical protein
VQNVVICKLRILVDTLVIQKCSVGAAKIANPEGVALSDNFRVITGHLTGGQV